MIVFEMPNLICRSGLFTCLMYSYKFLYLFCVYIVLDQDVQKQQQ